MKKRYFPWVLLFILLFLVFTAPSPLRLTHDTDNIPKVDIESAGIVQGEVFWDHVISQPAVLAVTLSATKTDALSNDINGNTEFDPGDIISYTVVIQNSGDLAEGVEFNDTIDPNTTLVAGSLSITPIARNDSYDSFGNVGISVPDGAGDVLANDGDPDGGTLSGVTAVQGAAGNVGSPTGTSATGSVTMQFDGSFTYEPPVGFTGTDSFTYQVTDDEGDTDDATVSIVVSDIVWFVDNSSGGSNLGTFSDPFTSIASFNASSGPGTGDNIYLAETGTNYTTGILLKSGQTLVGEGATGTSLAQILGVTLPPHSNALPPVGGTRPELNPSSGNGITLGGANTVAGLNVENGAGHAIFASGIGGDTSFSEVSLNDNAGIEIQLVNTNGTFTFDGGSIVCSAIDAIHVSGGSVAVTFTETTLTHSGGNAILINNGHSGSFSYQDDGTNQITQDTGTGVAIDGSSGTYNIDNLSVTNGTTGISVNNSSSATSTFRDISITATTGVYLTTAGTVTIGTVDETNTVAATGGPAVNITNTTISSSGVTFESISSSGGSSSGLILNNTGNSGVFEVTGDGSNPGSGGRIQNKSGGGDGTDGINMNNVSNVRLRYMIVDNNNKNGIFGHSVNGLILDNVEIDNNSNQVSPDEAGLHLLEFTGTGSAGSNPVIFSNIIVKDSHEHNVKIENSSGVLNVNVNNSTFSNDGSSTQAGSNFLFLGGGSANMTLIFDNNIVTGNDTAGQLTAFGLQADASAGIMDVNVTNNTFNKNNVGVGVSISGSANTTFDITNNPSITRNRGIGVNIFTNASSTGSMSGQITNNTIGTSGVTGSGSGSGSGIRVSNEGPITTTVLIDGNTVQEVAEFEGIYINESVNAGTLNATITNNNVRDTDFDRGLQMSLISGGTACGNISGNTFTNIGGITDMRVRQTSGIFNVTQADPSGASPNLSTVNNNASVTVSGSFNFSQTACATPAKAISDAGFDLSPANIAQSDSYRIFPETINYDQQIVLTDAVANEKDYADTRPNTAITIERDPVYLASTESLVWMSQMEPSELDEPQTESHTYLNKQKPAEGLPGAAFSGEIINVPLGTLDPGQLVTIEFKATIDDPLPSGVDRVQNQGTVSGDNFSDVLTTDPSPNHDFPPVAGETITPVNVELDLSLTVAEGWRMLSSPIDGLTYETMLGDLWIQGSGTTGTDYDGGTPNVYTWPNDATGNWTSLDNLSQTIPAGSGFLMFVYADDVYDQDPAGVFPKILTLSGLTHAGDISPDINSTTDGWTLVGNPYIAPIHFDLLTRPGLTGVAYVYDSNLSGVGDPGPTDGNTGGWRTTDGNFGDLTGGIIAPGQGFLVQNEGAPGTLTFTEASKTTGGQFYGKQNELSDFLRLEVRGESGYNAVWIRFSGEGSEEPANGDALELQPLSDHYALMGARKTDGTLLDIAHFPLPDEDLVVPLAVETTQGGSYTITATQMELPAGMTLYLYDRQTGESMPISDDSFEYSFTIENSPLKRGAHGDISPNEILAAGAVSPAKATTIGADRFVITTSASADLPDRELPEQVALEQNYPNPFNPSTVISYQLPVSSEVRLDIYDMLGRRMATLVDGQVAAGTHQVSFDANSLSSGVYLYQLTAGSTIITKKLTVLK